MSTSALVPPLRRRRHPIDPIARRLALLCLSRLQDGELSVVECGRCLRFGAPGPEQLAASVHIRTPHAYTALLGGGVGLASSYVDGLWDCDDLVSLVRILSRNLRSTDTVRSRLQPALEPWQRAVSWLRGVNTKGRARRRVSAHYDIGNDLFRAMLDDTMMYSCAVFPRPQSDLREASIHKMEMICHKLQLTADDHLLEIGTGWGSFAVHAARNYGCRVTTATISGEQYASAIERVARADLGDRVEVVMKDYRDLRGTYDKLVSIEMIEAIGWRHLDTFCAQCARLLRPDGLMVLQAIVTSDPLYRQWRNLQGFANSVIFPGGCILSVEAMLRSASRTGGLRMLDLEDISPHYERTLRSWRDRFADNRHALDPQRYDERFARLWCLYLSYCEGAFAERRIRDVQLVLAGPDFRGEQLLREAAGASGVSSQARSSRRGEPEISAGRRRQHQAGIVAAEAKGRGEH